MREQRFAPATLLNVAPLTCGLLVTCILLYLVSLVKTTQGGGAQGIGGISPEVLMGYGMASAPQLWIGRWHHLVMPMFLHGNAIHILFNMMWLYQLGPSLEAHFGTSNFGSVYFLSGIFGTCVTLLATGGPSVGASGAVFGMMGAVLAARVVACHDFSRAMKNSGVRSTAKYIAFLFLICFLLPRVDHFGHFGGLVAGCLYGWLFETWRKRRVIGPLVLAGMLSITVTAVCMARWTFYSPHYHVIQGIKADEEGHAAERDEHFDEAVEWAKLWRSMPAALAAEDKGMECSEKGDLAGYLRYQELLREVAPRGSLRYIESPVLLPDRGLKPPASPDDTPPKDSDTPQGGGPEAKSEQSSSE